MDLREKKSRYKAAMFSWLVFECITPAIFIILAWPIAEFMLMLSFPFERVLSSADLIPVGCVILIAVAREVDTEHRLGRIDKEFVYFKMICQWLTILSLCGYVALKYHYLSYTFEQSPSDDFKMNNVIAFSPIASLVAISSSIAIAFMIKCLIIKSLRD